MNENNGKDVSLDTIESLKSKITKLEEEISNINKNVKVNSYKRAKNINFSINSGDVSDKEYYGTDMEIAEEITDNTKNNNQKKLINNPQLLLDYQSEEKIIKSYKTNRNKLIATGLLTSVLLFGGVVYYSQLEKHRNQDILNKELTNALKEVDKKIEEKAKVEVEKRLLEEKVKNEELEKKIAEQNITIEKLSTASRVVSNNNNIIKNETITKQNTTRNSNISKSNSSVSKVSNSKNIQSKTQSNLANTNNKVQRIQQTNTQRQTEKTKQTTTQVQNQKIPSNQRLSGIISKSGGDISKTAEKGGTAFDDWMTKNNKGKSSK